MIKITEILSIVLCCFITKTSFSQDLLTVKGDFDINSSALCYVNGGISGSGSGQITNNGDIYIQQHSTAGSENWTNNVSTSFLDGTGTVTFNSGESQYITGTQKTSFYNLTINNSGTGIIMGQNADVTNNLTMTDGELDLQNYNINLGTTGTLISETAGNRIKVSDPVTHTGTITATRDVSNVINYNLAGLGMELTTNANLGTTTIIRGHQQQQGSGSFSGNYSIFRYYDASPTTSEETTIKFNYFEDELNSHVENQLIMYHDIGYWQPMSTTTDAANDRVTATTNSFSKFTLGSISIPLPIELLYFIAQWKNQTYTSVKIKWETASEINNDYFVIERSKDAVNFNFVLTVNGNGSSNQNITYTAFDNELPPATATIYYRLKQVDYNGNYTYSDIRAVYPPVDGIEIISIYPNPAEDEITFEVISMEDTDVDIFVIDNTGKKVIHKQAQITKGENILKLNIGFLSSACYTLQLITESGLHKTQKEFIKK